MSVKRCNVFEIVENPAYNCTFRVWKGSGRLRIKRANNCEVVKEIPFTDTITADYCLEIPRRWWNFGFK